MDFLEPEEQTREEIVKGIFDLNDLQKRIFDQLKQQNMTVQEVSGFVDRDRSTVQRALKQMHDNDVVVRKKVTDGTVFYTYAAPSEEEVNDLIKDIISTWQMETLQILQSKKIEKTYEDEES